MSIFIQLNQNAQIQEEKQNITCMYRMGKNNENGYMYSRYVYL